MATKVRTWIDGKIVSEGDFGEGWYKIDDVDIHLVARFAEGESEETSSFEIVDVMVRRNQKEDGDDKVARIPD